MTDEELQTEMDRLIFQTTEQQLRIEELESRYSSLLEGAKARIKELEAKNARLRLALKE